MGRPANDKPCSKPTTPPFFAPKKPCKNYCYWLASLTLLTVLAGCGKTEPSQYTTAEDLAGKNIGVVTGMIHDKIAEENIPNCKISYFVNYVDMAEALSSGKIDAYLAIINNLAESIRYSFCENEDFCNKITVCVK